MRITKRRFYKVFLTLLLSICVQAPKEQKSKEAKAIAAANSSKGKKKVRARLVIRGRAVGPSNMVFSLCD